MFTGRFFDSLECKYPGQNGLPGAHDATYDLARRNVIRLVHVAQQSGLSLREIESRTGVSIATLHRVSRRQHEHYPTIAVMRRLYFGLVHDFDHVPYQWPMFS